MNIITHAVVRCRKQVAKGETAGEWISVHLYENNSSWHRGSLVTINKTTANHNKTPPGAEGKYKWSRRNTKTTSEDPDEKHFTVWCYSGKSGGETAGTKGGGRVSRSKLIYPPLPSHPTEDQFKTQRGLLKSSLRNTAHLMFPIRKLKLCLPDGFKSTKWRDLIERHHERIHKQSTYKAVGGGAIKWLVNKDVAGEPQMNRGGQNKAALHYIK